MKILQINSSARSEGSQSTRLANSIVERLKAAQPDAELTLRDLASQPQPALDEAALGALFTPAEQRTAEQNARVAQDDLLIAEVQAADVLVLGFLGLTDIEFVYAEGMAMGPEAEQKAIASALQQIEEVLAA
jgi:FMN-dependent NADH-azoreductase